MSASPREPPPHWEKRGNTTWVSCARCAGWFPVDEAMLAEGKVECLCPHCGHSFPGADAREVISP